MVVTSACSFTPGVLPPDARPIDAGADAMDPGTGWSPPTQITELFGTPGTDDPSLTNDLLQIYFGSTRSGGMGNEDIWMAKRTSKDLPFDAPVPVTQLNSGNIETTMKITGLGTAIFFASDRAGGGMEIYVATRPNVDSTWSNPIKVDELSTINDDWAPFAQSDQLRVVTCHGSSETTEALYVATRLSTGNAWGALQRVSELDEPANSECDPNAPSANVLYYSSDYLTPTKWQTYRASRTSSGMPYGNRTGVSINLQGFDNRDPWVSPEETTLVFASNRGGSMQLYMSTR